MSLSLLQGYSSPEEEEDGDRYLSSSDDDDDDRPNGGGGGSGRRTTSHDFKKPSFDPPNPSSSSLLPSALDAFSEISGPPQFLNNSIGEPTSAEKDDGQPWRHGRRRKHREGNDLPAGAVMEAKPQLVGIRERVSSDAEVNNTHASAVQSKGSLSTGGGSAKRVATAANPNAEDAADLLRMCVRCGIPKTFSNARGMVCPMCGDRPDTDESSKKKGSLIKDKEKSKRMKGQSSHATWKSETEMQLRQQFD